MYFTRPQVLIIGNYCNTSINLFWDAKIQLFLLLQFCRVQTNKLFCNFS
uniref:Uncharacterized protein n=1 Tax=Anguilla anguilla TaxID=7936 RepID=A0A0E9WYM1_ANGAN